MIIVADSSALIALAICQGLHVLDQLFHEVKVPQAVFEEVIVEGKAVAERLREYLHGKVVTVDLTPLIINAGRLGQGELEAMALYKQLQADYLLVDDKRARKIARLNHIEITGSQGILLMAKQEGIIPAVKPYLERLQDAHLYLDPHLIGKTFELAQETP